MLEFIAFFVIFIPIYIILILTIKNPEKMAMIGTKWRYKGRVEPSKGYIRYTKISAIISIIGVTLIFIFCLVNYHHL